MVLSLPVESPGRLDFCHMFLWGVFNINTIARGRFFFKEKIDAINIYSEEINLELLDFGRRIRKLKQIKENIVCKEH